jgi:GSCFA family
MAKKTAVVSAVDKPVLKKTLAVRKATAKATAIVAAGPRNIERMNAGAAMLRASKNSLRRYPSPERDGDRLYPLASPTVSPSFEIGAADTIFAIGSCFARNVEKALEAAGKRVLSREFDLGEIGASLEDGANFFNKYSIHSVYNEIRWALERDSFPGADIIYEIGKDRYVDPQLGMARLDFPLETILAFRHRYLDAMKAVVDADVIILTLGYVETWYDRKLDLYLNVVPPSQVIKAEPERFEFRVLSYGDIMQALEALHALLLKHRTKPLKMLVTVSPVPLLATFRDMDVLVANAYSKSVQRAALDEFLLDKAGVDYFPSYEFVALSNPSVAWSRGDYRHVSQDLINRIMSNVLTHYVVGAEGALPEADAAMTKDVLASSVRMMMKLSNFQELVDLVGQHRDLADADVEVLMAEATAARRLEKLPESYQALDKAVQIDPGRPDALERMIMLCRPMRLRKEARALMQRHEAAFPDRADFRDKLTWV